MVYKKVANAFHYLNQNIWKWLAVLSFYKPYTVMNIKIIKQFHTKHMLTLSAFFNLRNKYNLKCDC